MSEIPKLNIDVYRGGTLNLSLTLEDEETGEAFDLTDYEGKIQMRDDYDTPVLFEMTEDNGRITIPAPTTGVVNFNINNTDTINMAFDEAIYDFFIFNASESLPLFEGKVIVHPRSTRVV